MAREESFFDALARGLADGSITRGKALRLMGAALAGGALGSLGIREAAGDPPGCKRAGKHCTRNDQCCGSLVCVSGTCQTPTTSTTETPTTTTTETPTTTTTEIPTTSTTAAPVLFETICFCSDGSTPSLGCPMGCTVGDKPIALCEAVCGAGNVSDVDCLRVPPGTCTPG